MGHGKSFTGNKILGANRFTSGSSLNRVTEKIQIVTRNNITIADCLGFSDDVDKNVVPESFQKVKKELMDMCPIDAIVYCWLNSTTRTV